MSANTWIRQIHRWISVAFTVGVIINIIASMQKHETFWIGLLALIPLIALLLTGLYLFALPYAGKLKAQRRTAIFRV